MALAIAAFLLLAMVIAQARSRRRHRMERRQQHMPTPAGDLEHDESARILIGNVAADGARSTLG